MVLNVSVAAIAVVMVVAVLFLIPVLLQIRRAAREVEKLAESARLQIAPVSHDLTMISQEATNILKTVRKQVDKVDESVSAVRDAAIRIREFEEEIQRRIEEPLIELAALVSAVTKGVEAFFRVLRR